MIEFLVALFIFSTVATGVLATQLAGKTIHFDAMQRSRAVAMANDLLRRIQANSAGFAAYVVPDAMDSTQPETIPEVDCRSTECTSDQLAAFDLWHWQRGLRGSLERRSGEWVGGLLSPSACVREQAGVVSVIISWQGVSRNGSDDGQHDCDNDGAEAGQGGEQSLQDSKPRQHIVVSSLIGHGI
jgi:type IV pilus assembly protein PilV